MAEFTCAMKSHGQLMLSVYTSLRRLKTALEAADVEPPPDEALSEAMLRSTRAIEAVDEYESSIDESHEDDLLIYKSQLEDMLDKLSRLEDSYLDDVARLVDALDVEPLASRQNSNSTICPQTGKSGQKGCRNCGFPTHLTKDGTCPASNATCAKCGKQGHYSHVCQSQASQGRQVNAIQVRGLHCNRKAPNMSVNILHKGDYMGTTCAYADSAADATIVGPHFLEEIAWPGGQLNLIPPSEQILAANKTEFLVLGSLNLDIQFRGRIIHEEIFIVSEPSDLLISWEKCIELGILHKNFPEPLDDSAVIRGVSTQSIICPLDLGPLPENPTLGEVSAIQPHQSQLKEKLQACNFGASHIKGKENFIADALSRAPHRDPIPDEEEEGEDVMCIRAVITRSMTSLSGSGSPEIGDPNLDWVRKEVSNDPACQQLMSMLKKGFPPSIKKVHPTICPFWGVRHELSEAEGLILRNGVQIVIPQSIRKETLRRLHQSHQGIESTRRRARQAVYWPGINSDISSTVSACQECQTYLPSQAKEPMISENLPSSPFVQVATDLFSEAGKSFLVMVDCFSGWPTVHRWTSDPNSGQVIKVLKQWFAQFGIPNRLRSDGGPQYDSAEFRTFCDEWNITHQLSSPHYPQSNSQAELCVKLIKRLVQKVGTDLQSDEFLRGILELRNTPKSHGKSPAELIYNRPLRSHVPSMMPNHVTEHIQQRCQASKENYDRTARELPPLRASSVLQRVLQLIQKRRKKTSRKSVNYVAVQESDECVLIYS